MRHLLVTNDFPPKLGGIQSYLWELWRRLPSDSFTVLTSPHPDAAAWDAAQPFRVERTRQPVLVAEPWLRQQIRALADEVGADLVLLDPALPLGLLGPSLGIPYGLVLHGAEITVPARLPGARQMLRHVLGSARMVVSAGGYPHAEAERCAGRALPGVIVPPGVDPERFRPLDDHERAAARQRLDLDAGQVVLSLSRLVPRKGMDVLIRAMATLDLRVAPTLVIAGDGRDRGRLERLAAAERVPVRFLGRVPDADLVDLYGSADVFAMVCRDRWRGLEQEGFGIVFLEAAACGVPQVAGRSGGSHEAVADRETGFVVEPRDVRAVAAALRALLADESLRRIQGEASRLRVVERFGYDRLAAHLGAAIESFPPGAVDVPSVLADTRTGSTAWP